MYFSFSFLDTFLSFFFKARFFSGSFMQPKANDFCFKRQIFFAFSPMQIGLFFSANCHLDEKGFSSEKAFLQKIFNSW